MITILHTDDMKVWAEGLKDNLEQSNFAACTENYQPSGNENFLITTDVPLSVDDLDKVLDFVHVTFYQLGMSYDVL